MIEAYIECLCSSHTITDLGRTLSRGSFFWLSEAKARASKDLDIAVKAGAVKLLWRERCVTSKPPPVPERHVLVPTTPTVRATPRAPRTPPQIEAPDVEKPKKPSKRKT